MSNNRLKVLVVSTSISQPAVSMRGAKTVYNLQKDLARKGLGLHILTHISDRADSDYQAWFQEQEKEGVIFHYFHFPRLKRFAFIYHLLSAGYYILKIRELQKKYHFDIIHEYTSAPFLFYRAKFYRKLGVKKIFHTIQTYNRTVFGSWRLSGGVKYLDLVIGVTQDIVAQLKKSQPRYQDKIIFLPLGLDNEYFLKKYDKEELRKKYGLPGNQVIALFVGPLEKSKGILVLQEAIIKDNLNILFLISTYGPEGDDQKRVKIYQKNQTDFLKPLNKNNFKLLIGRQSIEELLALADIFVLPAITEHGTLGYPAILAEAMAAGRAIIASNLAGINELIKNDQTGILAAPGSEIELRQALSRLAADNDLRQKLGDNAQKLIISLLANDPAEELFKLYSK